MEFKKTNKKKFIALTGIFIVISTSGYFLLSQISNNKAKTPEYQTTLPQGKSIKELGGWKRISPPGKAPVFAYADSLDDVPISVSQQTLPKSFKENTNDELAELAKKFNATTKVDASGIPVYIGTSAKGPQSTIFAKNNLLILIKSQSKIDNKSWARYAKSLN